MKFFKSTAGVAVAVAVAWMVPAVAVLAYDEQVLRRRLENASAVEAVAIGNELKWNPGNVRSFVTPREVVFRFSDGGVKKFRLPGDRMLVAVAPYVRQTHQ